jgi:uncharacterized membrane protein
MRIERALAIIVTIALLEIEVTTGLDARWADPSQRHASLVSKILNLVAGYSYWLLTFGC